MLQKKTPVSTPRLNGVLEQQSNSKDSSGSNVEVKTKENKEQNHCQEDSDEQTEGNDKKKKGILFIIILLNNLIDIIAFHYSQLYY